MLLLLFRTDGNQYAFDARRVSEVVPRVALRKIPHAPGHLAGLMSYRGKAVPVIDFGVLIGGRPARDVLSTRVILTEFTAHDGASHLLGVVAENVSHVLKVEESQIVSPGTDLDEAPYLGAVLRIDEGLVQLVAADKLLTIRLQGALYGSGAATEAR